MKGYLDQDKEQYNCLFAETMLYIVCEYLDDLNLDPHQRLSFIQELLSMDDVWMGKASENLRLSLCNLIFKCYLRDPEQSVYKEQINKLSP